MDPRPAYHEFAGGTVMLLEARILLEAHVSSDKTGRGGPWCSGAIYVEL